MVKWSMKSKLMVLKSTNHQLIFIVSARIFQLHWDFGQTFSPVVKFKYFKTYCDQNGLNVKKHIFQKSKCYVLAKLW